MDQELEDLVRRSKSGEVREGEIQKIATILADGSAGRDTYKLLYVLGKCESFFHEELVASFLSYENDPMVARLALQILCSYWGLVEKYKDYLAEFLSGVHWDVMGDVRAAAITIAGDYLRSHNDADLLAQLLSIAERGTERLERRFAVEAVATALGESISEVLNTKRRSDWETWAQHVVERGRVRLQSEQRTN
ncbi:hypothetical protein [Prauserella shujinwangii]|uniref:hypothetical protein n=1 Tax=Prauserella shujinwangii TaxID=1453103 RepID=UPI0011B205A6|nr:hypothetical protein [Prauserella shujinwangii]